MAGGVLPTEPIGRRVTVVYERDTRWLTIPEVAERLRWHRASVYRAIHRGDIPAVRLGEVGASLRVREDDLDRWLLGGEED
jgi:excisionase family DNA binding protein